MRGPRSGAAPTQDRGGIRASVRGRAERDAFGPYFRRHEPLGTGSEAYQDELPRSQLGDAETAQCLHVHKNVRRSLAAGQKSEATQPIEPFDLRTLQSAGG